ncbi:MAG: AzlC family ABC transporter permease [Proteobacteria bacterium]|nr:AzlC family ABC transporter permease [Pseudomonadota bacterium]
MIARTHQGADTFAAGVRAGLPVVLGYLGIGAAAGVVERAAGFSYAEVVLLSMVLYAGSAQFVLTSMVALASPLSAIVLTVFFVNARHLLLSAALAPFFRRIPAWKNALLGLQLTDETFVVAAARFAKHPPAGAAWMAGLNLAAYTAWALANLAGAVFSAQFSGSAASTRVLGFALPCMFAGLLVLQLGAQSRLRTGLAVAVFAATLGVAVQLARPGPWAVIVATLAGATLGLALDRWTSAPKSSR